MKKLTLTAEADVIEMAKKLAQGRGTSVSAMFSQLVRTMASRQSGKSEKIGPITRRMTGIAKSRRDKTDKQIIGEAILRRYG